MRLTLALVTIGLLLTSGACQRAPLTQRPTPVVDHLGEARNALAARQWAGAAEHLRAALQTDPQSLFLHYNLAICATWLDMRDEATREFRWVVTHARAESEEATTARRWLASDGDRAPTQIATAPAADDPNVGDSSVHGTITWSPEEGQSATPQAHFQLFLKGLRETPSKEREYVLWSDEQGRYEFKHVVAGSYQLSDVIAGRPKWRLKVVLEPGRDLAFDLTPGNSTNVRDDFPQGG